MTDGFWSGRRVFVTGHTGFKGSWLSLWLEKLGAEVTGVALAPATQPNLFEAARVRDNLASHELDILDYGTLSTLMKARKPEIVFHMAAQPLVRESYEQPLRTFAVNCLGTANVLEGARHAGSVRAVVVVTTDKCYENREWVWAYRENDPLGGHDPYSASKACAELVTASFRKSYGAKDGAMKIASVRAGNVIGGGDWTPGRLVPDILRALEEGRPVTLRHPGSTRPWQHVLEPLSGYLTVAEKLVVEGDPFAEAWNFGPTPENVKPVRLVAEGLAQAWGGASEWVAETGEHLHEATRLNLDSAKAAARLGWAQRWDLQRTLSTIVDWHKAFLANDNVRALCLRQIDQYSKGMAC